MVDVNGRNVDAGASVLYAAGSGQVLASVVEVTDEKVTLLTNEGKNKTVKAVAAKFYRLD